jgi:transcription initiation factor TFIID subunit 7
MEEEEPQPPPEEQKPQKKKDNKVDKKYLYPHGITPPLKNVRKRRFRKTLKKKVGKGLLSVLVYF